MAEENKPTVQKELQSKTTMILICIFLGCYGIDRLLLGYKNWWVKLITLGGCGIWNIMDLIKIIKNELPMADGRPLKED